MHILWFTGVQLPAVTGQNLNRAGWQEGLRRSLNQYHPDLKLSIASFGSQSYDPFQAENATYYNICRKSQSSNRWERLIENWRHRTYKPQELDRIYEILDQVRPDLVFIFGTENPFGLLSERFSVPTIISIQAVLNGLVKSIFLGLSPSELLSEFFSRSTLVGQGQFHKWWTHKKSARIERQIYQSNHYFCGRTDWDKDWMVRLNPEARYFHIDRVLGKDYYNFSWNVENSTPDLVFSLCGNAPFKGGVTLVRALASLKSCGNKQVHLRLAGVNQDSSVGQYIHRIIKKADLGNQVTLLGRLNSDQIVQEMLNARLFVLPSHMDNSPNSLAEAMILGMPCLASNAAGIPSMLENNVEGLLYDHLDIRDLGRKIEQILNDSEFAQKLGQNARRTGQSRHNPENIADATYHVYQEVLAGTGER